MRNRAIYLNDFLISYKNKIFLPGVIIQTQGVSFLQADFQMLDGS